MPLISGLMATSTTLFSLSRASICSSRWKREQMGRRSWWKSALLCISLLSSTDPYCVSTLSSVESRPGRMVCATTR